MLTGEHLGLTLSLDDLDGENGAYFGWLARGELRLQRCGACGLMRTPPTSRCPFCGAPEAEWAAVEARGAVYSYTEVYHAIQPAFAPHVPYMVLLVELDAQRGRPGEHDGLRIIANLATPEGEMAPPELVAKIGIGSRVRMVFKRIGEGIGLPMWALDEAADQPTPWRYPE